MGCFVLWPSSSLYRARISPNAGLPFPATKPRRVLGWLPRREAEAKAGLSRLILLASGLLN